MTATAASRISKRICAVIRMVNNVCLNDGPLFPSKVNNRCPAIMFAVRRTANVVYDTQIGTRHVILAKHWMWLPDDGFMLTDTCWSSFYNFNCFNNLMIL